MFLFVSLRGLVTGIHSSGELREQKLRFGRPGRGYNSWPPLSLNIYKQSVERGLALSAAFKNVPFPLAFTTCMVTPNLSNQAGHVIYS